jgi:diguanylate cyclase (GGDEF)-like protein/PAS domain S-box-containing protein
MKSRQFLRALLPWLMLVALVCILLVFYMLSSTLSDKDRSQAELDVRQMLTLDTRINLDMMCLHHLQLRSYDSLADSVAQVTSLLHGLQDKFTRLGLPDALKSAVLVWEAKETLLEDFKRQNTVFVNSLNHFVNLSRQLHASKVRDAGLLNAVTRDVLVFVNEQQTEDIPTLLASLGHLETASQEWPELLSALGALLAAHGRQIVNNHIPVQHLMRDVERNSFTRDLEQAYGEYVRTDDRISAQAENYRRLMAIFSLLMVISVVLIVLRLQYMARELERSHSLLDNIAAHLGEGILSFDGRGKLIFMNQRAEMLLGRNKKEVLGTDIDSLWPPEEVQNSGFRAALQAGNSYEGEEWLQRANGVSFPVVFLGGALPHLDDSDAAQGYVASFRDVTVRHQDEARLRVAASVFENLSEAMTITGPDGRIQSINLAFTVITGYSKAEALGKKPGEVLGSGQHGREFFRTMWDALNKNGCWQGEIINRRKSGETYPEWLSITVVRNEDGHVEQYIGLFTDISERKQAEANMYHLAYHDPLTGLANRPLFNDRLNSAISQAHRRQHFLVVMLLDLDNFKSINSLGHRAGDLLLVAVSQRLSGLLREGDTLSRHSGDEFSILLPSIASQDDAAMLASRLLFSFEKPFELEGREVFISTSIGIAVYPSDGENAELLLKNADVALYNAKDAGRSVFRFFQQSDSVDSLERLELETDLRRSVLRGELRLYYQPQVSTRSGAIYGVEALVRWRHPTRGLLMPGRFIGLAENTGYIEILGRWCLETACRQMVEWQKTGIPIQRVAVNVSPRQLRNPDFMDMVLEIVEETGINPNCLEIELTESSMADDPEHTFSIFSQLRKKGIRIAIDDFGTGYSSLSYLARYPVDVVKIDMSFIAGLIDGEQSSLSLVQAVVLMAHTLGMETVAEGVETEEQRQKLSTMQCDLLQGYLYSRPCTAASLIKLPCVTNGNEYDDDGDEYQI